MTRQFFRAGVRDQRYNLQLRSIGAAKGGRLNSPLDIDPLLRDLREGSPEALAELAPVVYRELRRLAAHCMRGEHINHTLQPTALVHECYLLLARQRGTWQNKEHFFAIAGRLMRRVLVDHAKAHIRQKRGGGFVQVSLTDIHVPAHGGLEQLIAVDESLKQLAKMDQRQSRVAEMRLFAGLTVKEIAAILGISEKSVKRDWQIAKMWLHAGLGGHSGDVPGEMDTD